MPNALLYIVSAMSLLKAGVWLLFAPAAVFGALYSWLLFVGPFERDMAMRDR